MGYVRIIKPQGCPEAAGQLMRAAKTISEQVGEGAVLVITGPCPETRLPHVGFYVGDPALRWKLLGWTLGATKVYVEDLLENVPLTSDECAALLDFQREYAAFRDRFFGPKSPPGEPA